MFGTLEAKSCINGPANKQEMKIEGENENESKVGRNE